jgi:hypothetical protein
MSPRLCLILGFVCFLAAQALASMALTPLRGELVPNRDVYGALKPGEFAGTLMLGGFRGLACDLLWLRAESAKDKGQFYESLALAGSISQIQPRFEQIWEYMAWDMAYNIAAEIEDGDGKWAWYVAGVEVNVRGCQRNPQSERLMRHLAWMFHHKGDDFRERIEAAEWATRLNPLLARLNAQLPEARRLSLLPVGTGLGNFQLSERLYSAALLLCDLNGKRPLPYLQRMVAIAIERDGNRLRNRGEHLAALRRYLESLAAWERVRAWSTEPGADAEDRQDRHVAHDLAEHNDGRLRRKCALLALRLADDAAHGQRLAQLIDERRFAQAGQELAGTGWRTTVAQERVRWLDER